MTPTVDPQRLCGSEAWHALRNHGGRWTGCPHETCRVFVAEVARFAAEQALACPYRLDRKAREAHVREHDATRLTSQVSALVSPELVARSAEPYAQGYINAVNYVIGILAEYDR